MILHYDYCIYIYEYHKLLGRTSSSQDTGQPEGLQNSSFAQTPYMHNPARPICFPPPDPSSTITCTRERCGPRRTRESRKRKTRHAAQARLTQPNLPVPLYAQSASTTFTRTTHQQYVLQAKYKLLIRSSQFRNRFQQQGCNQDKTKTTVVSYLSPVADRAT